MPNLATSPPSDRPLHDQRALVTGASRGIGRAVAMQLGSLGAHLLLVARDEAALADVQQQIAAGGGAAEFVAADLCGDLSALTAHLGRGHGCDVLVNAAGVGKIGQPLHEMAPEDFDRVVALNLRAPYLLMRAVTPGMIARGHGHIVNISSLAGQAALPNGAAYAASKWGLNGLSYSAAEELRASNIRVAVVAPGSVNTGFSGGSSGKDPAKKLQAEDVAAVVAMLVTQPPQSFISEVRMRPTVKP